jgi:hypothetical protein
MKLQEQISRMKSMMMINETEGDCANCDCWTEKGKESYWNGENGVPKITISKSETNFTIDFTGKASGRLLKHGKCGKNDTMHQLCNVLTLEINTYLKDNNLKPEVKDITIEKTSNYFKISVPLTNGEDGYYYKLHRRGGMGHAGNYSDLEQFKNKDGYEEAIKTGGNVTEKFITYKTKK